MCYKLAHSLVHFVYFFAWSILTTNHNHNPVNQIFLANLLHILYLSNMTTLQDIWKAQVSRVFHPALVHEFWFKHQSCTWHSQIVFGFVRCFLHTLNTNAATWGEIVSSHTGNGHTYCFMQELTVLLTR